MTASVQDVLENILAKKIDKQDALKKFNELSEEARNQIVVGLKSKLLNSSNDVPDKDAPAKSVTNLLKSVHETDLTEEQKKYLEQLSQQFAALCPKSKHNAQVNQVHFVDQRKAGGLKKALKPMQFQLTYDRGEGAYLYDIDGNKYVDITGDQGVNLFGHQPEFMKKALISRLNQGYPLVAYSEDLFESARLFCELTGHERMVYAQSGTESLMWAVRIARAATGKKKIVFFDGSYHGLSDAVLAVRGRNGISMSMGPGLLQEFADMLIILDYGKMEHLDVIEQNADEIACVLVEPVQSRFPARRPHEFLRELRKLTLEKNVVLIFDEMITGFRAGPKGAEGYYKVKPDMTTYGKVAGGGMPTGIIAGLAKYMDWVDGGVLDLDDGKMPSLKRALMAGTHTQNSLKVTATLAVCRQMKELCTSGPECDAMTCTCALAELNRKSETMCKELNAYFDEKKIPLIIDYFGSLFRFTVIDDPYGLVRELFIILLKINGVETSVSGNCFVTLAHSDPEMRLIADGFRRSVDTLLEHRFFHEAAPADVQPAKAPEVIAQAPRAVQNEKSQIELLKELILADLRGNNGKGN